MGSKAAFSYAPLEIDQVRWYWNKQPYSLKAVHQLDVQSRSQLTRYCEEDSNALEQEYRYKSPSSHVACINKHVTRNIFFAPLHKLKLIRDLSAGLELRN